MVPMVTLPFVLMCLVPVLATLICMAVLVKDFNFLKGVYAIVLGFLGVIPIAALQFFIEVHMRGAPTTLFEVLLKNLLVAGFVEETIKMLVLLLIPCRKNSAFTFLMFSFLTGLSLAAFETIVYVIAGSERGSVVIRMATAVVVHIFCAGLSGMFVYSVKSKKTMLTPYLLAVCLHGVYDYFAGFKMNTPFFWFSIVVVLVLLVEVRIRYRAVVEPAESA